MRYNKDKTAKNDQELRKHSIRMSGNKLGRLILPRDKK